MNECEEHTSHLVRKRNSAGNWMYTYQCTRCGQIDRSRTGFGAWIPKPATVELESLPIWNDDLSVAAINAARGAAAAVRAERDLQFREQYECYMNSDQWHALRRKVLKRDNYLCQGCLEAAAEHVHHLTYERLGNELLCDLVSLCRDCHQLCHPHRDLKGRELHGRSIAVH